MSRDPFEEFFHAYIVCALWSSNDESDESGGEPLDKNYDRDDITPESIASMKEECRRFYDANASLIVEDNYIGHKECTVEEMAGHDFWLTRNGHGCGFWETYDWASEAGTKLDESAKQFGECCLIVGDDKLLYFERG